MEKKQQEALNILFATVNERIQNELSKNDHCSLNTAQRILYEELLGDQKKNQDCVEYFGTPEGEFIGFYKEDQNGKN